MYFVYFNLSFLVLVSCCQLLKFLTNKFLIICLFFKMVDKQNEL